MRGAALVTFAMALLLAATGAASTAHRGAAPKPVPRYSIAVLLTGSGSGKYDNPVGGTHHGDLVYHWRTFEAARFQNVPATGAFIRKSLAVLAGRWDGLDYSSYDFGAGFTSTNTCLITNADKNSATLTLERSSQPDELFVELDTRGGFFDSGPPIVCKHEGKGNPKVLDSPYPIDPGRLFRTSVHFAENRNSVFRSLVHAIFSFDVGKIGPPGAAIDATYTFPVEHYKTYGYTVDNGGTVKLRLGVIKKST